MRAGLAAVCVFIAFVASPAPRTLAQTGKPAASDAQSADGTPPANAPSAGAPPTATAPTTLPEPSPQAASPQAPSQSAPATPNPAAPTTATPAPQAEQPPAAAPPTATTPSPPANPSPPPAAKSPPAPPPTKSVLDKHLILGILGKEVKSAKGEDMGRVVDVIVDWTGQTRAAIIDFGGFLGVGSRRIAVDWTALHFEPQQKGDQITLDLTRDQVKAAPEYKEGQPVVVLGPSGTSEPIPYE